MNRDKPEMYRLELEEEEEAVPLTDYFTKECNVKFIKSDKASHILALDFDDPSIMVQNKKDLKETYRMNLLYARKHFRPAYDFWYKFRHKYKMK